jgi:hypothetical protein
MDAITEMRLDIISNAEGAGTELSPDLMEWLRASGLSVEPAFKTAGTETDPVSLVAMVPTTSEIRALVGAVVSWMTASRDRSNFTLRISASGQVVELQGGVGRGIESLIEVATTGAFENAFKDIYPRRQAFHGTGARQSPARMDAREYRAAARRTSPHNSDHNPQTPSCSPSPGSTSRPPTRHPTASTRFSSRCSSGSTPG